MNGLSHSCEEPEADPGATRVDDLHVLVLQLRGRNESLCPPGFLVVSIGAENAFVFLVTKDEYGVVVLILHRYRMVLITVPAPYRKRERGKANLTDSGKELGILSRLSCLDSSPSCKDSVFGSKDSIRPVPRLLADQ